MLTKDLLRYRVSGAYAKLQFISTSDPRLMELASNLIGLYENSIGSRREELEESIGHMTMAFSDAKLAKGLAKILADRSVFSECAEQDYPEARHTLFLRSASILNSPDCPADWHEYRDKVLQNECVLKESVYPDLPENERLVEVKKIFPRELLERYNVSLVQTMLLFSDGLECKLYAEDPAQLRRVFKYLKFFRLLFRAELEKRKKDEPEMIRLKIDGPTSILENSTRYGLQLASFFPAVCSLHLWKLSCELKLRDRHLRLLLDESSNLVSHYTNFSAYIPEEFKMFQDYFNKAGNAEWKLIPREGYLRLEGNQLAFPDFRFRSADGREVDVELFHQWHKFPLKERLDYLEKHSETNLILGADRSCFKKEEELKARFENRTGNFLFSSFPGVENTIKALERFAKK